MARCVASAAKPVDLKRLGVILVVAVQRIARRIPADLAASRLHKIASGDGVRHDAAREFLSALYRGFGHG
jgi:hypothetical protein